MSDQDLAQLDKNDLWGIDRWAAGNFSESASATSDIPFYTSLALPFLFTLNKATRHKSGQLFVMYLESLSTTAALFSITAGLVEKSRPLVYNDTGVVSRSERLENDSQRSFYSGHVAASATATFFAAQVFSDFFPDSRAKPYVWAGAALIPATVGYFRIESGKHFLTDTIIGYALGAASGILVPRLHRKKESDLKVSANMMADTKTINLSYVF
ncbi:phosphatase PAP2 family protein [Aquimarina agarivorans]|uniref:phosphatase PAP2 family protein n=1 Tax=Aquimarina agarivorans TaxID=980584 RepID=UPI000248FADF|nr:phosphatase PAP2 family protein [Aquimarina agarivorans]